MSRLVRVSAIGLALGLAVTALPISNIAKAKDNEYKLDYTFASKEAGKAQGTITFTADVPGEYKVFWSDVNDNNLTKNGVEYTEISTLKVTQASKPEKIELKSSYYAIPENAKKLIVKNSDEEIVDTYEIPDNKIKNYGEKKYDFAVMSDVHYNRYPQESKALPSSADLSVKAFDEALKFNSEIGVNKLFLTGDLSNQGELDAYNKYNTAIKKYPDMTVYTCMGNHDVSWTKNAVEMVNQFKANVNTKKNTDKKVVDIAGNNLDFVYNEGNDYFVILSQVRARYYKTATLLDDSQITWLNKIFNKYSDKNIYVFFHTYLANYNGDVKTAVGNLVNPAGYTYDLTYPYKAKDEVKFRELLNKYSNVTLFSGHSHWAYDQVKYNPYLMMGNVNAKSSGATLIHVPSLAAPRTIESDTKNRDENFGEKSEATVATRYDKTTVYTGIDYKLKKFMGYGVYEALDGKAVAKENAIKVGKSKISKVSKIKKTSKKSKKYQATVKIKKASNAVKYQVQYSTNSKFKKSKTKTITVNKLKFTIKKLKKKTKYFIRVRAVGYQFYEDIYTSWSGKKKFKTKK